jgi:hypothetical protein
MGNTKTHTLRMLTPQTAIGIPGAPEVGPPPAAERKIKRGQKIVPGLAYSAIAS